MSQAVADHTGRDFLQRLSALPHGKKVKQCLQCGTCSASCPTRHAMDYSPRQIVASLRAGLIERVLGSNTVWLCTSCYSCTVRCPAGIPFTDVMYELKRLEVERGLRRRDGSTCVLAESFVRSIDRHGRIHEPQIIRRFYLHTRPWKALGQLGLAFRLLRRGRLTLRAHSIRNLQSLRQMLAAIDEKEAS